MLHWLCCVGFLALVVLYCIGCIALVELYRFYCVGCVKLIVVECFCRIVYISLYGDVLVVMFCRFYCDTLRCLY